MKEGDFLMKYGHFDDVHQEYVITTPKTPLPWINYLGCNEFFSLISNTCGGYTFYKDAKLLRLTRYRYNNVPADINGKYLYIKDGDTVWNPGWQPTKTELDSYECRHGIGYSRFTSSKNGVKASVLSFVPLNDNCEISQLTLTNGSSEDKKLSVFSYVEWCLWNADDDMKNFQRNLSTGEVEVQDSTIYHKTEYRERRNHYAIYSVNTKIDGFDTSRDAFLGAYRGADSPEAVENGKCTNSMASGWSPIASHQINVDLAAGETKTFIFVLGYIENPEDEKWESYGVINKTRAKEMLAKYQTDAQVDEAFAALQAYWKQLLARYTVDSADEKVNRMVNTWNQYQCMVTFNMSRYASYYESGIGRGMGFRDSCQDLLGFVHLIPDRARERIIDIASTQFQDGSAYHQYQPLTKKGNSDIGSGFNDDPLWLIAGTSAYVRETGDTSILTQMVPFDNDMSVAAPLMDHLKRSLDYEYRSSPRLFLVLSREDTLHDKLVGTPIPETDNRRTDKCTQPRKVGIPVIAYEIGHGITVIVDSYVAANAHHLIPTAQFFKSENQDDKRSEKKYRSLQYRGVEYRFHTAENRVKRRNDNQSYGSYPEEVDSP